jgi:hypothetical protein
MKNVKTKKFYRASKQSEGRQGSAHMQFNMVIDEIIKKLTEG